MNKNKDIIVIGFALFSMFFGAGNLIFPPFLGYMSGDKWIIAAIGFIIAAVGLTFLAVLSTSYAGGNLSDLTYKVGEFPGSIISFCVILFIGPLLAIPRTAATTHEVLGYSYGIPSVITTLVFFSLVLFLCLRENSIIDNLGKVLTPILLVSLILMIVKGFIKPIGSFRSIEVSSSQLFSSSFFEGYQTMDLLAAGVFTGLIMNSVKAKGYTDKKTTMSITIKSGLLAIILLAIIYAGLTYLGATISKESYDTLSRVEMLIEISNSLFGNIGKLILSLAMTLACLTTAVGLTSSASEYFNEKFHNISYNAFCIIITIVGIFFALNGVDNLLKISAPILTIFYPLVILLVILNLFNKYIPYNTIYKYSALGALLISILQGISASKSLFAMINLQVNLGTIDSLIEFLPLAKIGFPWVLPAIIGGFIGYIIGKNKKQLA